MPTLNFYFNEKNEKVIENVKINWDDSTLSLADQAKIQAVFNRFQALFSDSPAILTFYRI